MTLCFKATYIRDVYSGIKQQATFTNSLSKILHLQSKYSQLNPELNILYLQES